jgi:glyoxylase-like metal-dependent hydrolase (beta-lactamase superfamily II)
MHTYTAGESGLFTNSYLLETDTGVVLIDTSLLNADNAALDARVVAVGKPLRGIFITHAHPDHFNGVFHLIHHRGDVPVYATAGVAKVIREIADAKRQQWEPVYGDQWPPETAYPTVELQDGQTVAIDDVAITAREIGPAESHADSYLVADAGGRRMAFIGDLAFHGTHPYTADGHLGQWLSALDLLAAELRDVDRLYPGHGAPTGVDVLAGQRRYLMFLREIVRRLADGRPTLTDTAKTELERQMTRFLPGAPLTWMITLGADAVATELNGDTDAR